MPKVKITEKSIDPARAIADSMRNDCGAISVFIGTVRDNDEGRRVKRIEMEAYDDMAIRDLNAIVQDVFSKYKLGEIIAVHRVGALSVGAIIVTIVVSASHRKDAFDACRDIVDRMKQSTPIWKKEFFEDGSKWVEEVNPHRANQP